jgi:hypothetical protein
MNKPEKFDPMWQTWSTYMYLGAVLFGLVLGYLSK